MFVVKKKRKTKKKSSNLLEELQKRNKEELLKYNKLVVGCADIVSVEELNKVKKEALTLKNNNGEIFEIVKNMIMFPLSAKERSQVYKEYHDREIVSDLLDKEISNKEKDLDVTYNDVDIKRDEVKEFQDKAYDLEDMCRNLDLLEITTSLDLDKAFSNIEKSEKEKLSFATSALLVIGSFLAFKNNKNIIGTILTTYLAVKVVGSIVNPDKEKYLDLCNTYIDSLEDYLEDATKVLGDLVSNLDNIETLESTLKEKYKDYLKEDEFKNLFSLIDNVKDKINDSLKKINKTKDKLENTIDESKVKVKTLEG